MTEADAPAQPVAIDDRRPLRKDLIASLAITAVLLAWAMMGADWIHQENVKDGMTSGLREACSNADCDVTVNYQSLADDCVELWEDLDANASEIDEQCGESKELALAGWIGSGMIGLGILLLIGGVVSCAFRRDIDSGDGAPWLGVGGGTFALLAVVAWFLMIREDDMGVEIGKHLWGLFAGSGLAIVVGLLHSPVFGGRGTGFIVAIIARLLNQGPPRRRSEGEAVRVAMTADTELQEFVLREAEHGQMTTSLVLDADILRLVTAHRSPDGDLGHTDRLALRQDALQGFGHMRLDWLDDFRLLWWGLAGAGLAGVIFASPTLAPLFAFGLMFTILQWADPEVLTFETHAGHHRKIIWRQGSNRELCAVSMDHLDAAMQGLLRDGSLDASAVDDAAPGIDAVLSAQLAARDEVLERQAQARIEAQARRAVKKEAKMEAKAAEKAAKAAAMEKARAEHAAAQAAAPPPVAAPPPAAAPPAAAAPPPAAAPSPVVNEVIPPPPTPAAPAPAPVPAPLPPPPVPPVATPPPPMMSPPPPMMAPPPPMAPPPLAPVAPPPVAPQPAAPIVTQAAPREESISDAEKDNLMNVLED